MKALHHFLFRTVFVLALAVPLLIPTGCQPKRDSKKTGNIFEKVKFPDFTIEAKPDSEIALNDTYIAQNDTVEVLKGWSVRYTAPAGSSNVKWLHNGNQIGTGSPFTRTEETLGTFTVKMVSAQASHERTLVVGEVESVGFQLKVGGQYTKSNPNYPHFVVSPQTPAIEFLGRVQKTATSPNLSQFRWGFIQSTEATVDIQFPYNKDSIMFHSQSPGTTVKHPQYYYYPDVPSDTNDAPKGSQLYGGSPPQSLGTDYNPAVSDTPGLPAPVVQKIFADNAGFPVLIEFPIQTNKLNQKFMVWQVAFHLKTQQYVPLIQQEWKLEWDSQLPGPFQTQVLDPPPQLTMPSDKSTSSDDYSSILLFPANPKDWIISNK
jgi:hypothetical protein